MTDDLEPFDQDVADLVADGKKEFVPDDGAKARIDQRLRLAIENERVGTSRLSRLPPAARTTFFALAIAASVALGAGLHSIIRPGKVASTRKTPPNNSAHWPSPVPPPPVTMLGALGGSDSTGRALLDDASARMMRSDPKGAVEKLEEHARTHASGPLTELREAMMVEALMRANRSDEAHARADHFFAAYPQSLLAPAVTDALREKPDATKRDE